MKRHFWTVALAICLSISHLANAEEIQQGVFRDKGIVTIIPCELKFSISEHWISAPKEVFDPTVHNAIMLGRKGLKDSKGNDVIPTVSVAWMKIDEKEIESTKMFDMDPIQIFTRDKLPNFNSHEVSIEKLFIWKDGLLTMRYASGWRFHTVSNGRNSTINMVFTFNKAKDFGVEIICEVPDENWPGLRKEVEDILRSFTPTSPSSFPNKEAYVTKTEKLVELNFRDRLK